MQKLLTTLTNMIRYYLKVGTLDDLATRIAFGFWCAILKDGDEYEKAALEFWKTKSKDLKIGWFHKLTTKLRKTKCWNKWFDRRLSKAIEWNGDYAEGRKNKLKEELEAKIVKVQHSSIKKSKHA